MMESTDKEICSSDTPKMEKSVNMTSSLFFEDENSSRKLNDDIPSCSNMAPTGSSIVDTDDTLSFVVLGKDSLDAIHASSLASYIDIQRKSISVDYNSMISSLNATEIQEKLNELLQENCGLKEALTRNTMAMKQHFHTLATWQEKIMKSHQNHMKKFSETRVLINYLMEENAELKTKLAADQPENTEMAYKVIDRLDTEDHPEEQKMPIVTPELQQSVVPLLINDVASSNVKTLAELYLPLSDLLRALSKERTPMMVLEKRLQAKKIKLYKAQKQLNEFESCSQLDEDYSFVCNHSEEDCRKNKEIDLLKLIHCRCMKSVHLLYYKLQASSGPLQFFMHYAQYIPKVDGCLQRLRELTTFDQQSVSLPADILVDLRKSIEECQSKNRDIKKLLADWLTDEDEQNYLVIKDIEHRLSHSYKVLISCYLKLKTDMENALSTEANLLTVLRACDVIVHELEVMLKANTDPDEQTTATSQTVLKKQETEDQQSLEEERRVLYEEKRIFEEDRKLLIEQKKALDIEYKNVNTEKELLQQERISLREEKASLDQQSQLYEDHAKNLPMEKESIQKKYEQVAKDICILHERLQKKEEDITVLQEELRQHKENANLQQVQLTCYEEDFKQEKKIKETLLEEKNKLDADLIKQADFTAQLLAEINRLEKLVKSEQTSNGQGENSGKLKPPLMSTFTCPKCDSRFTSIDPLQIHIQSCLDWD